MRFDEQNRRDDEVDVDNYWGTCPECHKTDDCITIGKRHWYFCKEHRTRWCVGENLFSTWRYQTGEDQRRRYDELDFGSFRTVESYDPPTAGWMGEKADGNFGGDC